MPAYLTLQAGYGTIRIFTQADRPAGLQDTHRLFYQNAHQPVTSSIYQVNAFVNKGDPITLAKQNRDALQQTLTMDYTITTGAAATSGLPTAATAATGMTTVALPAGTSAQVQQLIGYLYEPNVSPWLLLLGLGLAALLGGLHALTPGHGKTLVAAYLVGSRGTARHAVALGGIVTFTHTASVILIGLLALVAGQFIVPGVLVPALEIGAGLLVVGMGIRLVVTRWRILRGAAADHGHDHSHDHAHPHDHHHDHDHAHPHTHSSGPGDGVKLSNLLALGVSGGLVPCPEALGIMVIAVGINQAVLGLGLILAFSAGLALVLITLGLLLVRARWLVERFGGRGAGWQRVLPFASAVIVSLLGAAIAGGGLMAVLRGG
jgi:ABC-type nickel/cobalt efflux system permease component RcnA